MRWKRAMGNVLGPLEQTVMRVLWRAPQPMTVRAVLEELNASRENDLAYTTVMTTLARLAEKGLLQRRRDGRGYRYEAAVEDAAELAVRSVVREFGDAALAHFVDEVATDAELHKRLQRLLHDEEE